MSKGLVISHTYLGDGASTVLLEATSYWSKKLKWTLDAVLPSKLDGEIIQRMVAAGMNPINGKESTGAYDFVLINCLQNIAAIETIDDNIPIILWAHEAETILRSNPDFLLKLRQCFARAALIIFQTPWQLEVFSQYLIAIPKSKVVCIPNGVTKYKFNFNKSSKPDSIFRISCMGKITPLKGHAELIQAVLDISKRHRVSCEFIGGTEFISFLPDEVKQILGSYPEIFRFTGFMPRRSAIERIIQSDLFCFPSKAESFGLAPLEAAAHEIPVLLSNLPVYQKIGWRAEQNCLMHSAGDSSSIYRQLDRAVGSPEELKKIAKEGVILSNQYDSLNFLKKLTESINSAINSCHY